MSNPLLTTKLHFPAAHPDWVSRPRLIRALNDALRPGHRLILISATAGFGKTTLLSNWIRTLTTSFPSREPEEGDNVNHPSGMRSIAWLSLDEGDNDPARFWTYFVAALKSARGELVDTIVSSAALMPRHSSQPPAIEVTLTVLINEMVAQTEPLIIVLDDYHVITSSAIQDAMAFLLEHLPSQTHLVIAARADPPLPLARLRARGQLTEIRASDLRFTSEETDAFLNRRMGLGLSKEDTAELEKRTEGWITGLQLAVLSMQGRKDVSDFIATFDGSHRYVMDYLFEEVLKAQTTEAREFLLQTAILDQLTASLCNAVTGCANSDSLLLYLEQANLFLVPLDDRREWYRYHHLFADFLRAQLPASHRSELHCKAAQWYEARELLTEAVEHALAAGDLEIAGRTIARAARKALYQGEVTTLLGWLDALPDEFIRADFWLLVFKGWALEMTGQIEASEAYVRLAEKHLPDHSNSVECVTIRAYIADDCQDWARAIALSLEALNLIGEADFAMKSAVLVGLAGAEYSAGDIPAAAEHFLQAYHVGQRSGNYHAGVAALIQLAWLWLEQGQRQKVAALCQEAVERCIDSRGKPLPIAGLAYVALGQACYQANELTQARQHLLTGLELLAGTHFLFHALWGKIVLARVYQALGEEEAAQETLHEVHRSTAPSECLRDFFAACEAGFQFRCGNIAAADRWLGANFPPTDTPQPEQRGLYLMYARVQLALGRTREAEKALAAIEPILRRPDGFSQLLPGGFFGALTDLLILQALACQAIGRKDVALAKLEEAVLLAAPEGCQRVFIEEEPEVLRLLLPRVRQVAPVFVDQLLANVTAEARKRANSALGPVEALTDRELQVLNLLTAGLRNQEIADQLVISLATVKRHISNINGKLGVDSRTQAIARGRELHLLSGSSALFGLSYLPEIQPSSTTFGG